MHLIEYISNGYKEKFETSNLKEDLKELRSYADTKIVSIKKI